MFSTNNILNRLFYLVIGKCGSPHNQSVMKLSTFSSFLLFLTNGVNISPFSPNGKPNWNISKCYQVFHFLPQFNAGECIQPSCVHYCKIFLVPDKMTAMEREGGGWKKHKRNRSLTLYHNSFVAVSFEAYEGFLCLLNCA